MNEAQCNEIKSLSAIYGDKWTMLTENVMYQIDVRADLEIAEQVYPQYLVALTITLTKGYLSEEKGPPTYIISAPWLSREDKEVLNDTLNDAFVDNIGQPIIHNWILHIQDFIRAIECEAIVPDYKNYKKVNKPKQLSDCPEIVHSTAHTEKRSVFVGHAAAITHPDQVEIVLEVLKSSKKIAAAKHNIVAYRCKVGSTIIENSDNDGESGAAKKMLQVMQEMRAMNVVVVVTRWFGGIMIGFNRYKHINNCTRELLHDYNFANTEVEEKTDEKKKRKVKK